MVSSVSTVSSLFKTVYKDGVENVAYKSRPAFALMKKDKSFPGSTKDIALLHGNPVNEGATLTQSLAMDTSSQAVRFALPRKAVYGSVSISTEAILASASDQGAFVRLFKNESDGLINHLSNNWETYVFGSGFGDLGRTTETSGTSITLMTADDVVNFEIGNVLVFAEAPSSGALRGSGGSVTVTAVNRATGVLTVNANLNTISGLVSGDYIFKKSTRQDSATPSALLPVGFAGWVPSSAPSSTSFFGVDRSVDPTRLGGQRVVGSSAPMDEVAIDAASIVYREGGSASHLFMNTSDKASFVKGLGAKLQYSQADVMVGKVGFRSLIIEGDSGPIQVHSSPKCPRGQAWMVDLSTWAICSLGDPIRNLGEAIDGLQILRDATSDSGTIRLGGYGNIYCVAPSRNCHITW